ncbi:DUF1653 domain-containing protein [Sulfurimonas sp. SWIR-19]|uniref:DUF1653 domain-containing protein n=1 Tax=Sulfurimonas sp. SWIR-19 TaxID=2878390 RepID=UPI001CF25DEE|nr:DUF1653 domain-containing protein [Sulfurimonas sp. SWIR-19]UCN00964.1 DUF1653 domain-containing protein [Sulfurimonas sp. SWIR-19]
MKTGIYEHYKGKRYQVIETVRHSETEELMVLYRALYGDEGLWVRPYSMFFETLSVKGCIQPRFRYLGEKNE